MEAENLPLNTLELNKTDHVIKSSTSPDIVRSYTPNNEFNSNNEEMNCFSTKRSFTLDIFYGTYADILVIAAVTAVFTEILHGSIPLFYLHVYIYLYFLTLSVVIFILYWVSGITGKFNKEDKSMKCEPEILKKYYSYLNFGGCFQFGLIVCGMMALFCSCLRSIAIFVSFERCVNSVTSAMFIVHSVFIGLQVAFLLMHKLSRCFVLVKKIVTLHLIATNVALLFKTVLWEISEDWQQALHIRHNSSLGWGKKEINISLHSLEFDVTTKNHSLQLPKHGIHVTSNCWWKVLEYEGHEDIVSIQLCLQNSSAGILWVHTSELFFSFNIQYYLIVIFLLYIMWKTKDLNYTNLECLQREYDKNNWFSFIFSKSFFFGCIIFITCVTIVIIHECTGNIDFKISMSILYIVLMFAICASVLGLIRTKTTLTGMSFPNQNFSNMCHKLGMYFAYTFSICNVYAAFLSEENYSLLLIFQAVLMILHVVLQYIFINKLLILPLIHKSQILVFLVLCNISLWVLESFLFWNNSQTEIQLKLFGSIAWPIIKRILIPCLAFYRFYSAAVFYKIWKFSAKSV